MNKRAGRGNLVVLAETLVVILILSSVQSCAPTYKKPVSGSDAFSRAAAETAALMKLVEDTALVAALPPELTATLVASARADGTRLEAELSPPGDPYLTLLVDKTHPLGADYEPDDLIPLAGLSYTTNRTGLFLRAEAAEALENMAKAANTEGINLSVSSAFRSYAYQKTLYERIVAELGQEAADRESARPGHSQHQLGLAVDFGSIDDSFAETAASRWLAGNAVRFGWSLSYPQGMEALTGYRWESWHYRYVGIPTASLLEARFGEVQQYGLAFLREWQKIRGQAE